MSDAASPGDLLAGESLVPALPAALPEVVQVALTYPPRIGGMENVTQAVAEHLAARYSVEVVTTSVGAEGAPRNEVVNGVRVSRFRGWTVAHTPVSLGLALRLLTLPRSSVIHAHLTHAFLPEVVWLTSLLRRRRYIAHFHLDVDPSGPLGFLLKHYKRFVFRHALRGARTVIALSEAQAQFLTQFYGIPVNRVRVVPNGVSDSWFNRQTDRHRRGAGDRLRLLFVGRLDAQKNVRRLMAAVERCPGVAELVVVGDGEERPELERLLAEKRLEHVRLVGAQRGADLERWYDWADAFILTSDREGMSISLLEAMASGLPTIATDVPGTRELLDGVGLLVDPEPQAIADAITSVAVDPHLRQRLAAQSELAGAELSWSSRIGKLEDIYQDLREGAPRC